MTTRAPLLPALVRRLYIIVAKSARSITERQTNDVEIFVAEVFSLLALAYIKNIFYVGRKSEDGRLTTSPPKRERARERGMIIPIIYNIRE